MNYRASTAINIVNEYDMLADGLYRKCDTYKGGGGYDRFPAIAQRRCIGEGLDMHNQFVVQLRGCPLSCPYCYVTQDGVHGSAVNVSTEDMIKAYRKSGLHVFHLMGGAPALYLEHWHDILALLGPHDVFHSDFLCLEGLYTREWLESLKGHCNALYAVSVKGWYKGEFKANTGREFNFGMFTHNLDMLVEMDIPFYFTFTNMSDDSVHGFSTWAKQRYSSEVLNDAFSIGLVEYEAIKR